MKKVKSSADMSKGVLKTKVNNVSIDWTKRNQPAKDNTAVLGKPVSGDDDIMIKFD